LIEVTIDGQTIKSEALLRASSISLPERRPKTGVFMNFASTDAASSTSGAALPSTPATNTSANYFGCERLYNKYEQTGAISGCRFVVR
jgi:hypothetical protein